MFSTYFHIPIFGGLMRRVWQQPEILCSKRVHLHHDHFIYNPLFIKLSIILLNPLFTHLPIILSNPLFINHQISLSNPLFTNQSINQSFQSIYSPIVLPNPLSKYHCSCILPNPLSNNHLIIIPKTLPNNHTIILSNIHQSHNPVPFNPLFTNHRTIQCHPIHYSLIVQPFSAHCPTTDGTYSTTSNSYLLMLHPIQCEIKNNR